MQLFSIAPWYGAKRTLAPTIVAEVGPHRAWWDLCFGSLAVTLAKPIAPMESAVDLHGDATNLARVLAFEPLAQALEARVSRMLMAEGLFEDVVERLNQGGVTIEPSVFRAADYLYASWVGINGFAGTENTDGQRLRFAVRFTPGGGAAPTRWRRVAESIPAWHDRLRGVVILRRDVFEVLPRIADQPGTVIYIDPPYVEKTAKYVHDWSPEQHAQASRELRRFKHARVLVSYYDHPLVRELYAGWTARDLSTRKNSAAASRRDGENDATAPELLIINGPSLVHAAAPRLPHVPTRSATELF